MDRFTYHLSYGQRFFIACVPVLAVVVMTLGMYLVLGDDARSKAKWQADMSTLYYLQSAQKYEPGAVWSSLSQSRVHALQALAYQPFDRGLWQHLVRLDMALQTPHMVKVAEAPSFPDRSVSKNIARRLAVLSAPYEQAQRRYAMAAAANEIQPASGVDAQSDVRLGALADRDAAR